jgi:hypothetical protein
MGLGDGCAVWERLRGFLFYSADVTVENHGFFDAVFEELQSFEAVPGAVSVSGDL